ncbi:siderophore ABC transporter substrate-binding protein [Mesobacillus harenae]|uniref:siderophore ABC transporter substrate-binding protein n=1 Tax=Mesobacillus harenae TaxID=2213203 RepID=UPI0015802FD6|nr:siderophore ABC transporter substrate-binding protein [Mesobacillus harenae]
MVRRKITLFITAAILSIVTTACGNNDSELADSTAKADTKASEELVIKHQLGETKVEKNPETVVVFDFGVLDTLDQLGVEVKGVPQANIPSYLEEYKDGKYENAGGLKEPDFEKISEMDPDVIIISGRQQDAYEELSEIAPTLFMRVDTANYMESFTENTKTLGEIFGKEKEVETELYKLNERVKAIQEVTENSDKNGLVILANEGNISAYGPGSRFGIIHDVFGVKPADDKIKVSDHGDTISFEYILKKDPDFLFVVDRGAAVEGGQSSAKSIVENELVKKTNAYNNENIVYLDPNYWYLSGGGLVSVSEMINEIEEAIK